MENNCTIMFKFLVITISCLLLMNNPSAYARTFTVQPGQSIKQIIEQANDGDLIRVLAGTYKEQGIVIDKSIVLMGIGNPVLDGEKKYEVISITAHNVVVEGFTIINSGYSSMNELAAIRIINAKGVGIRNNKLLNNFFGIYCQHASKAYIANNTISSNGISELESGNGIHGWKSDSLVIYNNNISGHRDGIYFEFVTQTLIMKNNSHKNIRYGLHFMFSNDDTYLDNIFNNNGSGVAVMHSRRVIMLNNEFRENWGSASFGILLKDISDSHVEGNLYYKNTVAIYMEGSSRTLIRRNRFTNNGYAIRIQASCDDNTIEKNNFSGNSFDIATNGSLVLNTFNGNFWDKYEGYDLNRNKVGDVPYRPLSVYAMIVERNATAMMLFRSPVVGLLEKAEKVMPGLTPENLKDEYPLMKPLPL